MRIICALHLLLLLALPLSAGDPADALARSRALLREGHLEAAHKLCHDWLESSPGDAEGTRLLGWIEFSMAERLKRAGKPVTEYAPAFRRARATLESAQRLLPGGLADAQLQHALGYCCFLTGDYDAAVAALDRAVKAGMETAELLRMRGLAYARQGKTQEALADLRRAVELSPADISANLTYASQLSEAGHDVDAVQALWKLYGRLDEKAPVANRVRILYQISSIAVAANDVDGGIHAFELILGLAPGDSRASIELGVLQYRKGELVKSAARLQEALAAKGKLSPRQRATALEYLGRIAVHEGKLGHARDLFDQSLALVPNNAPVLENLGSTLRRLGEKERARKVLERFAVAVRVQDQIRILTHRLLRNPRDRDANIELIRNYLSLGWADEAQRQLQEFAAYVPGDGALAGLRKEIRAAERKRAAPKKRAGGGS